MEKELTYILDILTVLRALICVFNLILTTTLFGGNYPQFFLIDKETEAQRG